MAAERADLLYQARLAEQTAQYDDLLDFTRRLARTVHGELTVEERNLLAVAYKYHISNRRLAWERLTELQTAHRRLEVGSGELSNLHKRQALLTEQYRIQVKDSIFTLVKEFLHLIETHLLALAESSIAGLLNQDEDDVKHVPYDLGLDLGYKAAENVVFYIKTVGDYQMVLAQLHSGDDYGAEDAEEEVAARRSERAYVMASQLSRLHLPPTHPLRLSLALNYAILNYKILHKPEAACRMVELALDDAENEGEIREDSTVVIRVMREHLHTWIEALKA